MQAGKLLPFIVALATTGAAFSACSNSAQSAGDPTPSPRNVCSVVNFQQVKTALGEPTTGGIGCKIAPGSQSSALYIVQIPGEQSGPTTVETHLYWGYRATHTFTVIHSGHAKWTTSQGAPIPPPKYDAVTVAGVPAYWNLNEAAVSESPSLQSIEAMKNGFLVTVSSNALSGPPTLSRKQLEKVLAVALTSL